MELRKICNHPYLVPEIEPTNLNPDEANRQLIESSGKLSLLKLLLPKLKQNGHRVLIFSQFQLALTIIEDFLIAEQHNYLRIVRTHSCLPIYFY
jgi:SNF2 family DNA or RNA helicase